MVEFRIEAGPARRARALRRAAAILRDGGVVAYPTDTLYGLAANPASASAIGTTLSHQGTARRSGRSPDRVRLDQIESAGDVLGPASRRLAARFWPGPLTLVVPAWSGLDARGARRPVDRGDPCARSSRRHDARAACAAGPSPRRAPTGRAKPRRGIPAWSWLRSATDLTR